MAITNNLTYTLQQLDADSNILARKQVTVSDDAATVGEWRSGYLLTTAQATISLAGLIAQIRQIYLRNTHATGKITVVWTPYGGAEVTVTTLGPGASIALWDPTPAATGIGISSLKLTTDVAATTFELYVGG